MAILAEFLDKMTGIILDGFVNTANASDYAEAQKTVREFLIVNYQKIGRWAAQHPGRRPPIYFNEGSVVWLNRKQNRKLQSQVAKESRRGRV